MEGEARGEGFATSRPSRDTIPVRRPPRSPAGRDGGSEPGRTRSGPWRVRWLGRFGHFREEAAENEILIHELRTTIHKLQNQVNSASNEANEAWARVHMEQKTNQRLVQTVKAVESERDSMSLSMKKQEAQIRQVQALAFEGIGGDSWAAGDDNTARADLENLHSRLRSWAKKYAIGEMSEVLGLAPNEHDSFIQLLAEVVRLRSGAPNVSGIEHLQSGPMNRKSPAVCIQGLLSHYVYAKIISQPFFVLGDAGEALENVYRAIHQGEKL